MFLRLAVLPPSSTFSNNSETVKLIFVHISHIAYFTVNGMYPCFFNGWIITSCYGNIYSIDLEIDNF